MNTQYEVAKNLYKQGKSLRNIENETGINRKLLSKKFKNEGIEINWGISESEFKQVLKMLNKGFSKRQICIKLNLDASTLNNKLKSNNLYIKKYNYDNRNCSYDDKIFELYNKNISIQKISEELNVSTNLVHNSLKSNNFSINNYNTYSYNESIFEEIDSEEKAYWLGFLYADGYVHPQRGIELTLAKKDKDHLDKFKNFIGINKELLFKEKVNAYRLNIYSVKISNDLKKLGCFQNKSLTLKFPTYKQVPKRYIHHFMRGYFDGDGCICMGQNQRRISIIGTKEFLDRYDEILIKECKLVTKNKYGHAGNAFELKRGGNLQVNKIFNFLYKDAKVYLIRKYTRFAV